MMLYEGPPFSFAWSEPDKQARDARRNVDFLNMAARMAVLLHADTVSIIRSLQGILSNRMLDRYSGDDDGKSFFLLFRRSGGGNGQFYFYFVLLRFARFL